MGITEQEHMGLTAKEVRDLQPGDPWVLQSVETYIQGSVRLVARDAWALQPRKYGTKSQGYKGLTA
jgi:hypothetical protein